MRQCLYCESDFTPVKAWQKYCSDKCRSHFNNARHYVSDMDRHGFRLFVRHYPLPAEDMISLIQEEKITETNK